MVQLSARRVLAATLALSTFGVATGSAVAHDGSHQWWKDRKTKTNNNGNGRGDKGGDGAATTTTTPAATTTVPSATTPAPAVDPAQPVPVPASAAPAAGASPPVPVLERSVTLQTASGTVVVRPPGGQPTAPLDATAQALPTGTRVDTRHGAVVLTSAVDAHGTTQAGRFSGGIFEVRQARGYTQLVMIGGHWGACTGTTPAHAAYVGSRARTAATKNKDKPLRRLWGSDDHGRFQTRGSGSVATVRGTRWLTEDSCAGTRTTVTKGAVSVRSRRTGRTVTVKAGHSVFMPR